MSIRTVLVAGMLAVALIPAVVIGAIGVSSISHAVRSEAQSRVNHDLDIVVSGYREQLAQLASALESARDRVGAATTHPTALLYSIRRELDLTVLNLCDAQGRPIGGGFSTAGQRVPLGRDPVLRRALEGKTAWGTVVLEPERLRLEGGAALENAVTVFNGDKDGEPVSRSGLLAWVACPIIEETGRVAAVLYGGQVLNFNHELVDRLQGMVFSEREYQGKPRGTVTLFLGDVRVATNVLTRDGVRAVGTRVSEAVRHTVLEQGDNYTGAALVVDARYLSAYTPLRDPAGRTIGMIYVGLLEAPYDDMRVRLLARFLVPVAVVGLLVAAVALFIVGRITRPVQALSHSARRMAGGDWEEPAAIPPSYMEIDNLAGAFHDMHAAIQKRDQELRLRNDELSETNAKLEQSNRNYMQTLGFVTHELKAPLAAVQILTATLLDGYVGQVPAPTAELLVRIQRNCDELQDMVRDYLDLSRVERGELVARKTACDLSRAVVAPAVDQAAVFFRSRNIAVEVDGTLERPVTADPELLRIALGNYLTNAAKYGREGGRVRVTVRAQGGRPTLSVWNEGEGFPAEEAERLFEKFYRLRNENTHARRGSGLGLFTVNTIAALHGGRAWAESEPGKWAAFHLDFPE